LLVLRCLWLSSFRRLLLDLSRTFYRFCALVSQLAVEGALTADWR
jgi:hypothetical protein